MMLHNILFYILSAVALLGGVGMVSRRHPLGSALALIISMIALAGLYALLDAPFLAILQVLVYAGAILALVVFVIMLLNVREEDLAFEAGFEGRVGFGVILGFFLFLAMATVIMRLPDLHFQPVPPDFGTMRTVGFSIFGPYGLVLDLVSLLLTAAMVGAVLLAKRRLD